MEQAENTSRTGFRFNEKYLSQIPALQLLINLGFEYLPPDQALKARGRRLGNLLFVNGIPFSVIECKSPKVEVEQAISQCLRNQSEDYAPRLFTTVQQVLTVNKNTARYATAGTPARFWGVWRELADREETVAEAVNRPLPEEVKRQLFSGDFAPARKYFDALEAEGPRLVAEQDRTIYSLCRPKRLLELAYKFTLFEGG